MNEPTAQDLAAKFQPTQEQRQGAIKLAKSTERNGLCPCGCGQKAKKCVNGRRVLEFKRYLP